MTGTRTAGSSFFEVGTAGGDRRRGQAVVPDTGGCLSLGVEDVQSATEYEAAKTDGEQGGGRGGAGAEEGDDEGEEEGDEDEDGSEDEDSDEESPLPPPAVEEVASESLDESIKSGAEQWDDEEQE